MQIGKFRINLPPQKSEKIKTYNEKQVIVGIRPEDFKLTGDYIPGTSIQTTVEVVEPIGNETYVNVNTGDFTMIVAVGRKPKSLLTARFSSNQSSRIFTFSILKTKKHFKVKVICEKEKTNPACLFSRLLCCTRGRIHKVCSLCRALKMKKDPSQLWYILIRKAPKRKAVLLGALVFGLKALRSLRPVRLDF